ncbi:MAG: hypothetical protein R2728_11870 [Chitinophagales bacterium]
MKKLLLSVFILSVLAACSTVELAEPNQTDVVWAQKKFPSITLSDLNEGKVLFEKNCGLCHSLKRSMRQDEAELPKIVTEMSEKVNKKRKSEVMGKEEQQLLLQYLVTLNGVPQ